MRFVKRLGIVVAGIGVLSALAVAALALRPVSTAPIEGPRAIATLEEIELGGVPQTILLRGRDVEAPILLYVHGGPGAGQLPIAHGYSDRLEQHFLVVHWDQDGAGASCNDTDWDSLSLDRTVSNTIELIEKLTARFGKQKIVLVGHSWGSIVGALTAHRRPDLLHAYVGVGQLVHGARNEQVSYAWVTGEAIRRGDEKARAELATVSPPYLDNRALEVQRAWLYRYGGALYDVAGARWVLWPLLFGPEYSLGTRLRYGDCIRRSLDALWGEVTRLDLFREVRELRVPVFLILGKNDWNTPAVLAKTWAAGLTAPSVDVISLEETAHFIPIEAPFAFQRALIDRVLPTVSEPR